MKIRIIVINPDNSLTIKKIKPKTFDIEINKNKYVLTNKDIMLRDTFWGLQRYAVFYQGNPISITNDITELSKNENIQNLIHNSVVAQFLDIKNMDLTTLVLFAIVGAIIGAVIGYQLHGSISTPAKTVIGNFIMSRW
jgi:hypothetical protein